MENLQDVQTKARSLYCCCLSGQEVKGPVVASSVPSSHAEADVRVLGPQPRLPPHHPQSEEDSGQDGGVPGHEDLKQILVFLLLPLLPPDSPDSFNLDLTGVLLPGCLLHLQEEEEEKRGDGRSFLRAELCPSSSSSSSSSRWDSRPRRFLWKPNETERSWTETSWAERSSPV